MKQLLQHLKEVREKANPDNYYIDDSHADETFFKGKSFKYGVKLSGDITEYQKEQLEIENLLYGYWERNVWNPDEAELENKVYCNECYHCFNNWLQEELDKLDE